MAYGAKCSYNFFAIAAKQLCNKIKTANEAVYMTEATIFQIVTLSAKNKQYVIPKLLLASHYIFL